MEGLAIQGKKLVTLKMTKNTRMHLRNFQRGMKRIMKGFVTKTL